MKKMKVEDSNKLLNSGDSKNSYKDETSKLFFEKNCIKKFVLLMNIFWLSNIFHKIFLWTKKEMKVKGKLFKVLTIHRIVVKIALIVSAHWIVVNAQIVFLQNNSAWNEYVCNRNGGLELKRNLPTHLYRKVHSLLLNKFYLQRVFRICYDIKINYYKQSKNVRR